MKIFVIGAGKIGQSIVRSASKEGHDITIIDSNAKIVNQLIDSYDVMGMVGNGASLEIQKEAGVQSADLVIAVTSSDEVNLLSCLLAHKLGADDTIARVRNPQYLKQLQFMKEDLGLSMSINPEYEAAKAIARNLALPGALNVETFANGRMELVELRVEANSILSDTTLIELANKVKIKMLVCAVVRGDDVIIPVGNFMLKANDKIYIAASHQDLYRFFQKTSKMEKLRSILMIGGGRIAYYFCQLVAKNKYNIKLIEHDHETCRSLAESFSHVEIIEGDGTDQSILESEGIENIDAFLALTGVDEENIIISMFAQKRNAKKIITKVNNPNLNSMMETIGMASVFSPQEIIANQVLSYIRAKANKRGSNVKTLYKLVDQKVEALEFNVKKKGKIVDVPLKNLKLKPNIIIAGIIRGNEVIIPDGNTSIQIDDSVIVITTDSLLEDLAEIVG
ncbi:MAG: Trk system potassium transporter TrkA [Erysipelotrichales bacterium]|nr:Trk system potassium transporter TrkA [Erysipelotrichales bacterium]